MHYQDLGKQKSEVPTKKYLMHILAQREEIFKIQLDKLFPEQKGQPVHIKMNFRFREKISEKRLFLAKFSTKHLKKNI
jgi:hypothetical protein